MPCHCGIVSWQRKRRTCCPPMPHQSEEGKRREMTWNSNVQLHVQSICFRRCTVGESPSKGGQIWQGDLKYSKFKAMRSWIDLWSSRRNAIVLSHLRFSRSFCIALLLYCEFIFVGFVLLFVARLYARYLAISAKELCLQTRTNS